MGLIVLLALATGRLYGFLEQHQDVLSGPVESAPSETATSTASEPPVPPPLTHRQFIRRLDHLCKVGNKLSDKKFGSDLTVSDTTESMDA